MLRADLLASFARRSDTCRISSSSGLHSARNTSRSKSSTSSANRARSLQTCSTETTTTAPDLYELSTACDYALRAAPLPKDVWQLHRRKKRKRKRKKNTVHFEAASQHFYSYENSDSQNLLEQKLHVCFIVCGCVCEQECVCVCVSKSVWAAKKCALPVVTKCNNCVYIFKFYVFLF